jgi:hypothetical protein
MGAFVQHVALVSDSAAVSFDQISTVSAALQKQAHTSAARARSLREYAKKLK